MQSLGMVGDKGFRKFCKSLDDKYIPPSRGHVRQVLLPDLFTKVQAQLKEDLGKTRTVSITTDMWISVNVMGFLAVTCHFWSEREDVLKSAILDCVRMEGNHTAEVLSTEIWKILQSHGVQEKIMAAVTDKGSNRMKAIHDLSIRHLHCYAHTFNLVVSEALKSVSGLENL